MRRFFIQPSEIQDTKGIIAGEEAHHMLHALRLKPGKEITLFDGAGNVYAAEITSIGKKEVGVTIHSCRQEKDQPPFLHLGLALLTGKKLDMVIQKATELGVKSIQPFTSRHNTAQGLSANKDQRLQKISAEACKQSGRSIPPEIKPQVSFEKLVGNSKGYDFKVIFFEDEKKLSLNKIEAKIHAGKPESVIFLTGPEGGFTAEEIELARQNGFIPVSLGSRILRAETAAISGSALLQYILGNLNPDKQ